MDDCVRRINLSEAERIWPPLASETDPGRRGLVNEAAFLYFSERRRRASGFDGQESREVLRNSFTRAAAFLNYGNGEFEHAEFVEASEIAARLETYFASSRSGSGDIVVNPEFLGCGVVGRCQGDVVKGETIFEVKSGERNFRSIDLRQIILYSALEFSGNGRIFKDIGIINPRTGFAVLMSMPTFCKDAAGLSPSELFERVLSVLTANLVSD